jgi:hypothetical protein
MNFNTEDKEKMKNETQQLFLCFGYKCFTQYSLLKEEMGIKGLLNS